MRYEEALQKWGAMRLERVYSSSQVVRIIDVRIEMEFDEGYACCGGSDPLCYCSFAESPRAFIHIEGTGVRASGSILKVKTQIDYDEFDFATILKELCDIGGGMITS